MNKIILTALCATALILQGCATKSFGRQGALTATERAAMNCREIELEQARVDGFLEMVVRESQFDGRDVLAFLGDFGIGNSMERNAATASAMARKNELHGLLTAKGCHPTQP